MTEDDSLNLLPGHDSIQNSGSPTIAGVRFDALTEGEVVQRVFDLLDERTGGHLITPNVDILRQLQKPAVAPILRSASLIVADGKPIIIASRLQGEPLPERVTGADLIWSLSARASDRGRTVYILGGAPGVAEAASTTLQERFVGLEVVGTHSPALGFEHDPAAMGTIRDELRSASPDIVFVALGFPKQDALVAQLRNDFPETWFVGCGAAIDFAAGNVKRAPLWVQNVGLEWVFRLAQEPTRLARRYLVDDVPFAVKLLTGSALAGRRGRREAA